MTQKRLLTSSLAITLSAIALISTLTGCAISPEAKKKAREETLNKFSKLVTQHLLDRNPTTLTVSVNQLMHVEVHHNALATLQARKILPDSNIDVLRAIDDAEVAKSTNEVQVLSVRALTPVEKDPVKFRVTGKEIFKVAGKQVDMRPFSLELTIRLTTQMDGEPALLEVGGMTANTAFSKQAQNKSAEKNKKTSRKRG